jgi:hypothetical protein
MYKTLLIAMLVVSVLAFTAFVPSDSAAYRVYGPAWGYGGYSYPGYTYTYGYGCGHGGYVSGPRGRYVGYGVARPARVYTGWGGPVTYRVYY